MEKVIVFTDLHLSAPGTRIIGLDPEARFRQGLEHALSHHPEAAAIVLAGDLTHTGTVAEYARLRALIEACPCPIHPMLGNHDDRAAFRTAFPEVPVTQEGFVQRAVDLCDTKLLLLDTKDEQAPDQHSGYLCPARLDWLDRELDAATDSNQRVILFTHHPPMLTGFNGMDTITLRNRHELIDRLQRHAHVMQIVSGHIHRTISGSVAGLPVAMFKSPCHQMPMLLDDPEHSISVDEPGAYGLLLLHPEGIIVHTEDFTLPGATVDRHGSNPWLGNRAG